jgi:diguanylate cyclase (GGDEF)-like protein
MTLRTRLAIAFFAVLVGPVMLGAILLAAAPAPDVFDTSAVRARATSAFRAAVAGHCHRLDATARARATLATARREPSSPPGVPAPWALCREPALSPVGPYRALAARAEVRDREGELTGYAYAVQPLDDGFLEQLSAAAGARVGVSDPPIDAVAGTVAWSLGPEVDQPLPVVLSVSLVQPAGTLPAPLVVTLVGGLVAAVSGWWLAGLATRPLAALVGAVERAAAGDLTARCFVRGADEAGRLGRGLDRLIAETQATRMLSMTDPLTGLGNVRYLRNALRLEIERADRFGHSLGVLALDLDHFKVVNDRFGHRAGDAVLVEFAGRVRTAIREVDRAFRPGGEEFVILLPETDVAGSVTVASRIGTAVRTRSFGLGHRGGGVPVTVSIGVAVFPRHAATALDLLHAADTALYAAKSAGRDTFALANAVCGESGGLRPAEAGGASGGTTSPRTARDG